VQPKTLRLGGGWRVDIAARTDIGSVRKNNEDSLGIFDEDGDAGAALLVVADGMGGAAAGEVASQTAVHTLAEQYRTRIGAGESIDGALENSILDANRAVFEMAAGDASLRGMGTTCTAVVLEGATVHLAHIGDSRAYRITESGSERLTVDHTLATELGLNIVSPSPGILVPPEAHNILTRCLGVESEVRVDVATPTELGDGDALLLCSDGLTGMITEEALTEAVRHTDPDASSRRLIELAKEGGGLDNITVIVARFRRGD